MRVVLRVTSEIHEEIGKELKEKLRGFVFVSLFLIEVRGDLPQGGFTQCHVELTGLC